MGRAVSFKEEFTFEQRLKESRETSEQRLQSASFLEVLICGVCADDCGEICKGRPSQDEQKYLVPKDMSVRQFIDVLSKRLDLAPGKAFFVFVKNTLPQTASLMGSIYEQYEAEDGFLYVFYSSEKTFGSQFILNK